MTSSGTGPAVVVGISGASGAALARHTIERLLELGTPVVATASGAARLVWQEELSEPFPQALARWQESPLFSYYPVGDLAAPIASGTFPTQGMVVVPCSMATVAALAHGLATNLLHRAADVCLKEGRRLVVVPRETPLSAIHLENMLALARLGVIILTPDPAFYLHPRSMDDVVAFVVERVLVTLGVVSQMGPPFRYTRREE